MEHKFRLDVKPKGSKQTLRESLLQVLKTTGRMPKQLQEVPAPPEDMLYLEEWFHEALDAEGLTYQKLYYWQSMTKRSIAGWEVEVLLVIDRLYWSIRSKS